VYGYATGVFSSRKLERATSARVPAEVLAKLEQWAADNGYARATAIALLLAQALGIGDHVVKKKRKPSPVPTEAADAPKPARTRPRSAPAKMPRKPAADVGGTDQAPPKKPRPRRSP
jgi:hypothetical protein